MMLACKSHGIGYTARNLTCVPDAHDGTVLQKSGRASWGESTITQLSSTVRPTLTPPETWAPPPNLALIVASTPLYTWLRVPKFDNCVTRLSTCPNFAGFRSYSPQSRSPLFGSRESVGALKQYSS